MGKKKRDCSHVAIEPVLGLLGSLLMLTRHSREDRHLQGGESLPDTKTERWPQL